MSSERNPHLPPPSPEMVRLARELRRRLTPAERAMWERIRGRKLQGLKFRRQHPLGRYVLDFFCDEVGLVVELDGPVHLEPDQRIGDGEREEALHALGLTVLRFRNEEVLGDLETVMRIVGEHVERLTARQNL